MAQSLLFHHRPQMYQLRQAWATASRTAGCSSVKKYGCGTPMRTPSMSPVRAAV